MKIYLAGGFNSDWQERVIKGAPQHDYYNPKTDADQTAAYLWTTQEIEALKESDLMVAFFEKDNPSGLGLAKEMGWATILKIPVIYIDEHDRLNEFLCACSKRIYAKLEPVIEYLRTL